MQTCTQNLKEIQCRVPSVSALQDGEQIGPFISQFSSPNIDTKT